MIPSFYSTEFVWLIGTLNIYLQIIEIPQLLAHSSKLQFLVKAQLFGGWVIPGTYVTISAPELMAHRAIDHSSLSGSEAASTQHLGSPSLVTCGKWHTREAPSVMQALN